MMYPTVTSSCFYGANFKELAPPTEKSQERIKRIYQLPDSNRSFSSHLPSSTPVKIPETFELEELDSYSGPVQAKKESNKPSTTSKTVTSSKATVVPKPSPIVKTHASSSHKRKEPDSPFASDVFQYENHGFIEFNKFMTGFLNQASILTSYPAYIRWLYILSTHIDTYSPD
ncbi:hypothetical protein Hanom_Chr15g01390031 [Helianthus anomalus]